MRQRPDVTRNLGGGIRARFPAVVIHKHLLVSLAVVDHDPRAAKTHLQAEQRRMQPRRDAVLLCRRRRRVSLARNRVGEVGVVEGWAGSLVDCLGVNDCFSVNGKKGIALV